MKRFALALALGFATSQLLYSAEIDKESRAIVEKAIEAHGGQDALKKYVAGKTTVKGNMSMFKMDVPFSGEVLHALPEQLKMQLSFEIAQQKIKLVQTINGKSIATTVNGEVKKLSDEEKAELKQALLIQEVSALLPLLEGKKFTVKALKDGKVGDAPVSVIRVSAEGMIDTDFAFDKKTGLMVKSSRQALSETGAKVLEESVMSDYKKSGGVLIPMKVVVTRDGEKFMTMTITEAKVLDKIDPKEFE